MGPGRAKMGPSSARLGQVEPAWGQFELTWGQGAGPVELAQGQERAKRLPRCAWQVLRSHVSRISTGPNHPAPGCDRAQSAETAQVQSHARFSYACHVFSGPPDWRTGFFLNKSEYFNYFRKKPVRQSGGSRFYEVACQICTWTIRIASERFKRHPRWC